VTTCASGSTSAIPAILTLKLSSVSFCSPTFPAASSDYKIELTRSALAAPVIPRCSRSLYKRVKSKFYVVSSIKELSQASKSYSFKVNYSLNYSNRFTPVKGLSLP
jgi:hypothetical protein